MYLCNATSPQGDGKHGIHGQRVQGSIRAGKADRITRLFLTETRVIANGMQELLEFYMYARYASHDDATLSYMEDTLYHFHTFKIVFLPGHASKTAKTKANVLRTELMQKGKVDKETNAETWTPSKKLNVMKAGRNSISRQIHQQKTFPSGRTGCVRVDVLRQSCQRHPGGGLLRARRQYHVSSCISPSDRRFTVSSRSVGLLL
jgi:hypothetical protein